MLQDKLDRDSLTGLLMRRTFSERLNARIQEALRRGAPLAVCLLDLDHFKRINDTAGHLAGDQVLASLGRLLQSRFRTEDLRGRWGGEEFVLAFPNESAEVVEGAVSRVLKEFHELSFTDDAGGSFRASFSAGLASHPADGASVEELLRKADHRMYLAKQGGRNRICREG
jgi:diguanylate cyclase (GGDEF)-like protein